MFINLLLYVMVVLRLWTAVRLFIIGRKNKLNNLVWLAWSYAFAIGLAFAPTAGNPLGTLSVSLWLFIGSVILAMFAIIPFIRQTFYTSRTSPIYWMWGVAIVSAAVSVYGMALSASNTAQHPLVAAAQVLLLIVYGWHGWVGYQAWRSVANEKSVEDWVKGRYQLVIWYCLIQMFAGLSSVVRIVFAGGGTASALGNLLALISLLCVITVTVLSYLAWAAPRGFYQWLNRNYREPDISLES